MIWLIAQIGHQSFDEVHLPLYLVSNCLYHKHTEVYWHTDESVTWVIMGLISGSSAGLRSLQWRHNERDCISNHQPHDCLLNRLFRRRSKKTSKLRVSGLCAGNSPVTGELSTQRVSNAEKVSIWWRHHAETWPEILLVTGHLNPQEQTSVKLRSRY